MKQRTTIHALSIALSLLPHATLANEESITPSFSTIEVRAQNENLAGIAGATSEGIVTKEHIASLPLLRPGEVLELVPGMIVTQHSGGGKANQYYLRGFNLDHGTDFATFVASVPANMPTHAHGQGYTDLNFLIPELVDKVTYRKGPYFADEGDFSSAGAAHIDYARQLENDFVQLGLGENGYTRILLAGSPAAGSGHLLYALEAFRNDGPWIVPEDYKKLNAVLRYSQGTEFSGWSLTAMAHNGKWTATDQVPKRAIGGGLISRFGTLNPTTGGKTRRYSLSTDWARHGENSQSKARGWLLDYQLDLYSDFTYCMTDPVPAICDSGDQFKQGDKRQAGGFAASHLMADRWGDHEVENTIGIEGRIDRIRPVGLYATSRRITQSTIREDNVNQRSLALYVQNHTHWLPWLRTLAGVRADFYRFKVNSSNLANSGEVGDRMVNPKLTAIFGPWRTTEFFINFGRGFHSNDGRGTTLTVNPSTGLPAEPVTPLVRSKGYEFGLRNEPISGWQTTLALWRLDIASELLFVGDAGVTEPSRPSRRHGLEWTNLYVANHQLAFDADLAASQARFRGNDPDGTPGNHIPGAVAFTANLGVMVDHLGPWFGAFRIRHFGPRPLIEDNSVRSVSTTLANLRLGYKFDGRTRLILDVFNLFDRKVSDIDYWYESQLRGETAPVADIHTHPAEPRTARITLAYNF
ncbi:MAG: TonB-dependent receptor [Betaproteobacteria bacterium HGW-Betaproteobacteria-11]|nr:MAG: TonB-dependent receptor [Betaproteobacteria bacterium HGW-Betaproteobacteria-11]